MAKVATVLGVQALLVAPHPYKLCHWRPRPRTPAFEHPFRDSAPCVSTSAMRN